jgi:hypothetical protein
MQTVDGDALCMEEPTIKSGYFYARLQHFRFEGAASKAHELRIDSRRDDENYFDAPPGRGNEG